MRSASMPRLRSAYLRSFHGLQRHRLVLARGFALVRDAQGQPLHAAANVSSGQHLSIEFADGRVGATADSDGAPAEKPKAPAKPAAKRATDFGVKKVQGDLF